MVVFAAALTVAARPLRRTARSRSLTSPRRPSGSLPRRPSSSRSGTPLSKTTHVNCGEPPISLARAARSLRRRPYGVYAPCMFAPTHAGTLGLPVDPYTSTVRMHWALRGRHPPCRGRPRILGRALTAALPGRALVKAHQSTVPPKSHVTMAAAWRVLTSETDVVALQHEQVGGRPAPTTRLSGRRGARAGQSREGRLSCGQVAEQLLKETLEPMKALQKEVKSKRDAALKRLASANKDLASEEHKLEQKRKAHEKGAKEAEEAQAKHRTTSARTDVTKSKATKIQSDATAAANKAQQLFEDLTVADAQLQEFRAKHYGERVRDVLNELQQTDEDAEARQGALLLAHGGAMKEVQPFISTSIENVITAATAVDPSADSQLYVTQTETGNSIQSRIEGGTAGKSVLDVNKKRVEKSKIFKTTSRKKTAIREDFGHLPPAQRKRALENKLAEVNAAAEKENKQILGLQKTVDVYTAQPGMGDAKALAQCQGELAESRKRHEALQMEITKFTLYLEAMAEAPGAGGGAASYAEDEETWSDDEPVATDVPPPPPPAAAAPMAPPADQRIVTVLYDFPGTNEGELAVTAGATLTVTEDDGSGWLQVVRDDGVAGFVPSSYVNNM